MRTTAIAKFDCTLDYWPVTEIQDPVSGDTGETYAFLMTMPCMVYPAGGGSISVITQDGMKVGSIVRNVKDRKGNLILADAQGIAPDYYVRLAEPEMNVFSTVEGWKNTLGISKFGIRRN